MRRQCELLGIQRSTVYYKPAELSDGQREYEEALMARIDYCPLFAEKQVRFLAKSSVVH